MRVAIMQPYFFPYLGHFSLIASVDRWVVFDTAQYIRRGWMNRNRILHPRTGWQYVNVPVRRHARDTRIDAIQVDDAGDWRRRLRGQIDHYRQHAPNWREATALVEDCLAIRAPTLSRLNVAILARLCSALGVSFAPSFASELGHDPGPDAGPGERVLQICRRLDATRYVNPAGGEPLLDPAAFERAGIALEIQRFTPSIYPTAPYAFEPGLSIIDALMWNPVADLKSLLG